MQSIWEQYNDEAYPILVMESSQRLSAQDTDHQTPEWRHCGQMLSQDFGDFVTLLVTPVRTTTKSSNSDADVEHMVEALSLIASKHALSRPQREDNNRGASSTSSKVASRRYLL
jgi:hypothetical protein